MADVGTALRYLDRKVSLAIRRYDLLTEGDRVLVGVSGGKDSLVLLAVLAIRQAWRPERYELLACHVNAGICAVDCSYQALLWAFCDALGVRLVVVPGPTLPTQEELASGRSACHVCSRRRRQALFEVAASEGCGSVALGHHLDDLAATAVLNLFGQGTLDTMSPRQEVFGGRFHVIRPLALVEEREVARVARLGEYDIHSCACPYARDSRRQVACALLRAAQEAGMRDANARIVGAVLRTSRR